jgi:hypothetical protein
MTPWGWVFLCVSWGVLTAVTVWCFVKIFTAPFTGSRSNHSKTYGSAVRPIFQIFGGRYPCQSLWTPGGVEQKPYRTHPNTPVGCGAPEAKPFCSVST